MNECAERIHVVTHLRGRLTASLCAQIVFALIAAVGLAALLAVFLDAVVVLSDGARIVTPWVLAVVGVAVLVLGVLTLRRLTDVRVARLFERRDPTLGTAVTNAVQLSSRTMPSPIGEVLRRGAVKYGRAKAWRLGAWPVVRRRLLVAAVLMLVTAALWVFGPILYSDVFRAVLPRFLDPRGDHPPFSRVHIEVEPGDAETLYGGQCEIRGATNRPVEKLFLVAEDSRGRTATVMFRAPDSSGRHEFHQTLTNLREETRYYLTDGRARSARHTIAVRKTPQITLVEVSFDFPDYTGMETSTKKLKETELSVPLGTALAFRVASNRPLRNGTIELTPLLGGEKQSVTLDLDEKNTSLVRGGFEAAGPLAFALSVTDTDGLVSSEPLKGRVTILPDRRPRIIVLEPVRHAIATPDVALPLHVRAEDDYGVKSILWFRGFNDSIERPLGMPTETASGWRAVETKGEFNLADLGVRPGDRIEYFVEAVDNYPGGPNLSTSPIHSVEIISEEEFRAIMRTMMAQQALFEQYQRVASQLQRTSERAQALQDKERRLAKKGVEKQKLREELEGDVGELRDALENYRKMIDEILKTPPLFDIEESFQETLRQQLDEIEELLKMANDAAKSLTENAELDPDLLGKLAGALGDLSEQTNAMVGEPAYMIATVANLLARADLFARLAERQEELARQLRRFSDKTDELSRVEQMELQELAETQANVRDAVEQIMADIDRLAGELPSDAEFDELRQSVAEFIAKFQELKIQDDLDEAAARLAEADGPKGYLAAKSAAEKMSELVKNMEGEGMSQMGERALRLRFQPMLAKSLGSSLAQIMAAMRARNAGMTGQGGYGLYGREMGLVGADMERGETALNNPPVDWQRDPSAAGQDEASRAPGDEGPQVGAGEGRVRLLRDAKFPLRYRTLVGEYFRAVAESLEGK